MSAVNFVAQRDSLYVFADAAVYAADGTIAALQSKLALTKRFPGVIATTGNTWSGTLVKEALSDCSCFDDLVDAARSVFDELVEDGHDIAVAVGGFSTVRDDFEVWHGGTFAEKPFGLEHTGRGDSRCGGQPPLTNEQVGSALEGLPRNITVLARTVLTLQRQFKWGPDDGYPNDTCLVGGFGELATVTQTQSNLERIIEWPEDRVGERIRPQPFDSDEWRRSESQAATPIAPAAAAPRMSRHERRAAAAKVRKAA